MTAHSMLRLDSTFVYYAVGLVALLCAIALTRRQWRWVWLVVLMAGCWLAALPHGL